MKQFEQVISTQIEEVDRALTTEEAARILGCKPKTLRNQRSKDEGPEYVKMGRLVRYRLKAIYKYLDQNTVRIA